jgi:hypothetical protein
LYVEELHIATDLTKLCDKAGGDLAQSVY